MKNLVRFVVKTNKITEPCSNREEARSLKRELKAAGFTDAKIERQEYTPLSTKIIR